MALSKKEKLVAITEMEKVGHHAIDTAHHIMEVDIRAANPEMLELIFGATALVLHFLGDAFVDLADIVKEDLDNAD